MIRAPGKTSAFADHSDADILPLTEQKTLKRRCDVGEVAPGAALGHKRRYIDVSNTAAQRLGEPLASPRTEDTPLQRFMSAKQKKSIDLATRESFDDLFSRQKDKYRPFIVAHCLCGEHNTSSLPGEERAHAEFADGSSAFEALEHKRIFGTSTFEKDNYAEKRRYDASFVDEFITRPLDFWAVNPLSLRSDTIMDPKEVCESSPEISAAAEAILFSSLKPLAEEEEEEQTFAYVTAGLYHAGLLVEKDIGLAKASVALMQQVNISRSQHFALQFALDIDVSVFVSLLELGLSPRDQDEQGYDILDYVRNKLTGDKRSAVMLALHEKGFV